MNRRSFLQGGVLATILAAIGIKPALASVDGAVCAHVTDSPPFGDLYDGEFVAEGWTPTRVEWASFFEEKELKCPISIRIEQACQAPNLLLPENEHIEVRWIDNDEGEQKV